MCECTLTPLGARVAWRAGHHDAAKEGLLKLGNVEGLLRLNVEAQRWDDALLLLAAQPQLSKDLVYLPYAKWLLEQDRCVPAGARPTPACMHSQAAAWCLHSFACGGP